MKRKQAVSLLFSLIVVIQITLSTACFSDFSISASEADLTKRVDELLEKNEQIPLSCLQILIEHGYYQTALYLYEVYFAYKVQEGTLDKGFADIKSKAQSSKKDLESLQNLIMTSNKEVQIAEPAFQWAQNKTHIFIQAKLALRLDSPACLTCREEEVRIEENALFMSAFGIVSHSPVRFKLDLALAHPISVKNSTWNYESVGTYFFSLAKKQEIEDKQPPNVSIVKGEDQSENQAEKESNNDKGEKQTSKGKNKVVAANSSSKVEQKKEDAQVTLWLELEKIPRKKNNIWWDMREKYKKDMDEWNQLREDTAERAEQYRKEQKKKARQEKKQAKAEQQKAKKEQTKREKEEREKDGSWRDWFSNIIN